MKMMRVLSYLLLFSGTANAVLRNIYDSTQLSYYISIASPGDELVVYPGIYRGNFKAYKDGQPSDPITIRSASTSDKAVIDGFQWNSYSTISIQVFGNYWNLEDLVATNANKGIVFDNANGGKIVNCEVHTTGEEAIHIRDGSSNVLIEGSYIHDTGLMTPEWGEGIYIGSDKSHHRYYNPTCSFVTVRNNRIGPNVRNEGMDVKEGTHDILIENNSFDAAGMISSDSFIDLKGTKAVVRSNTFNQNGNTAINKAINVIDRGVDESSHDHVIAFNTFNMAATNTPMVQANRNTNNIYVKDNTRSPSGTNYGGSVIDNGSLPSWYSDFAPQVDATKSYSIYANSKVNDAFWQDMSSNGFFLHHHNDGGSHRSTIYASLQSNGKLYFVSNGADLTGLSELRFFVRTLTSGAVLRMKVNGISGHVRPKTEWHDHTFDFSFFVKGKDIDSITFENISGRNTLGQGNKARGRYLVVQAIVGNASRTRNGTLERNHGTDMEILR